jgi:membrane fusion protein (multidrug efflux system)
LYAITERARLELEGRAYAVDAPVAGRVLRADLVLGREVHAGDLLVELDSELDARRLDQARARAAAIGPQIEALQGELSAHVRALGDQARATLAALDEQRARVGEAELAAELADKQARRADRLLGVVVSAAEGERSNAEALERHASVDALTRGLERMQREQRTRASEGTGRIEQLRRELGALQGAVTVEMAEVHLLEQTIDKSRIRSPVDGRIGEIAAINAGAYIKPSDRLCSIVPGGKLKAVAEFAPADALGRVREGMSARLRLDGFPWTQYGTLAASVASVGREVRDGHIRVELEIHPPFGSRIPLQHGLTATAEIDVERVTPARLIWRSLGGLLGSPIAGGAGT